MAVDRDAEHLALYPTVEALDHAVGFRVYGLVLRCSISWRRQEASKASAVKQDPRSVSRWVTRKGRDATASSRKATLRLSSRRP